MQEKFSTLITGGLFLALCALFIILIPIHAFADDARTVYVKNHLAVAADDLHITFTGTGGDIRIQGNVIVINQQGQIVANNIFTANPAGNPNTLDMSFDPAIQPDDTVVFRINTIHGPLAFDSGFWTLDDVNIGAIQDITVSQAGITKNIQSPLKQLKSGISVENIQCKDDFQLVIKSADDSPACVKSTTAEKLVQRGWGRFINDVIQPSKICLNADQIDISVEVVDVFPAKGAKITAPGVCSITAVAESTMGTELGRGTSESSGGESVTLIVTTGEGGGIFFESGDKLTVTVTCPCLQQEVREYVFRNGQFREVF